MEAELAAVENDELSYRPSTEVYSGGDVEIEQIFCSREGSSIQNFAPD